MLPAEQQAALAVLAEATRFLFSELGKKLDFWRKKKGDATPQTIEPQPSPGAPAIRMDDVEQAVNAETLRQIHGSISTSMSILEKLTRERDRHREKLITDTLVDPKTRTYLENRIPEVEQLIEEEAKRLEELLEKAYRQ